MAKKAPSKRGKETTARRSTPKKTAKAASSGTSRKAAKASTRTTAKATSKSPTRTTRTATSHTTAAAKPAARAASTKAKPKAPAVKAKPATTPRPKKAQSGLNKRDLEYFRDLLLEKRRQLVGDMSSMEREALNPGGGSNLSNLPVHMADMGTDNYEQEFTLGLVEKDRTLLREINLALARIQNGTYGICEGTGNPIGRPRLEAKPWARYSIEYARKLEKEGRIR